MYPKYNLFCYYPQFNHMHAPKYFDWVTDGTGELNFWVDDFIKQQPAGINGKPNIAMLIEPRTIQPTLYTYVEEHAEDFDLIFSHDKEILKLPNSHPIFFMQWYKTYDVTKTKNISMVCSDKAMCKEHKARQRLADILGNRVDHYGMYKGGKYCDYYECRAPYMFEVVVDNNWSGYWLSEKLANPLASKTIPIYLGGEHFPDNIDQRGIIIVKNTDEIPKIVDKILLNPYEEYYSRIDYVEKNYLTITRHYQVFEDWLFKTYGLLLSSLCVGVSIISNNCVGGCLLHDLKIEQQSPTVNLQILPEEFPKFCKYINHYIQIELKECKPEDLSEEHKQYVINMFGNIPAHIPYALCGDVLVCFQHYNTFAEGKTDWDRRVKRFHPNNVAYMFYVRDPKYMDALNEFVECNFDKAIVFTENFDVDIPIEHYKILPHSGGNFLDMCSNGHRWYEQWFNPADWMNRVRR